MRWSSVSLLVLLAACGGDEPATTPSDGGGTLDGSPPADGGGGDTGTTWDGGVPPLPPAACAVPVPLADTSKPTTVVGTGTPASCTEDLLRAAVTKGGIVTFDCGAAETTIVVKAPLAVPTDKDTTIDGNHKIVLSGGGTSRILALDHSFEKGTPTLTVQRLTLTKARTTDVVNTTSTKNGGAAIYNLGGNVVAIDSTFSDDHGPSTGQDVSGGAIFSVGVGSVTVEGCVFAGNDASNGGAVGILGSNLTVVNSSFTGNTAIGSGGNPGNGGNGGAVVMDGQGKTLTICGATFSGNTGHAYGGAVFRTSYQNEATTIDRSLFDLNQIVDKSPSQAGALYLQGTKITLTNTSLTRNKAKSGGAMSVYEHGGPAPGQLDMVNVTIADNAAHTQPVFTDTGLAGGIALGARVTGTWANVTIVGNTAQFGSGVTGMSNRFTVTSSIFSNEASNLWVPLNCTQDATKTSPGGSQNLQFPLTNKASNDVDCVSAVQRVDPKMGLLEDRDATKVRVPQAGSPALGLGMSCPATDQLGKTRKASGCTAGAVEVP